MLSDIVQSHVIHSGKQGIVCGRHSRWCGGYKIRRRGACGENLGNGRASWSIFMSPQFLTANRWWNFQHIN